MRRQARDQEKMFAKDTFIKESNLQYTNSILSKQPDKKGEDK